MADLLVILGTGVFAEEVADLVADLDRWEIEAFVEGLDRTRCSQTLLGRPILWIDDLQTRRGAAQAVCAVGSTARGGFIEQARAAGLSFTSLIHPTARVPQSAVIGQGAILSAGVVIGAQARIDECAILNRGCLVGHHVEIGARSTLGPGCNIGGLTRIGEACSIGMGAIVLDRLTLGCESSVGAGALVTRDVGAGVRVVGSPARPVRFVAAGNGE
jgi:acetyltransferase EpsM